MIRIAITDDHTLFRKSLSLLVGSFENTQVVVEAANGKELLEKLQSVPVDIVLLDLQMPEMDGFETSLKINELYPDVKILILTLQKEEEAIKKVMEQGVHGYFTKNTDPSELKNAIVKLSDGGFYFEKSLSDIIQHILEDSSIIPNTQKSLIFTEREMDIVRLTLKEYSGTQIAYELNISPKTVEKHKRNLMEKTGSKNFIGVIMCALVNEFITLDEVRN